MLCFIICACPFRNLLWVEAEDRHRLEAILRGKRESRMGHEHSEDAVTWNVFRIFERHGCLAPATRTICPCPGGEPRLTVFWTTHEGCLWEPFQGCSDQIPEKAIARSESDLIFVWEHKLPVVIEANFRSPNCSDAKKTCRRTAQIPILHRARFTPRQPGGRGRSRARRLVRTLAELAAWRGIERGSGL
jgi:hypothetical protein